MRTPGFNSNRRSTMRIGNGGNLASAQNHSQCEGKETSTGSRRTGISSLCEAFRSVTLCGKMVFDNEHKPFCPVASRGISHHRDRAGELLLAS